MTVDVVDLREFYATPLGHAARRSLLRSLSSLENIPVDLSLVGLGYPIPLIARMEKSGSRALVLMPARQGALAWPPGGPSRVALVDEHELPLADDSVDCLFMLHMLENTADPADALQQAWRVLAPEGRLIVIAANRRGLWARFEHTPFGNGRPFSRQQLGDLLRAARLTPVQWGDALHFPPMRNRRLAGLHRAIEATTRRFWPAFSGAITVVATKRLYQGVADAKRKPVRSTVPVLAPQGARVANSTPRRSQNAD